MPTNITPAPELPTQDSMSILTLITDASIPVQIIMLILVIISIISWSIIISKYLTLKRDAKQTREFEQHFWSSNDLTGLHQTISKNADQEGPLARIFSAGMGEFLSLHRNGRNDTNSIVDGATRAMKASYQREMDSMDSRLSFLATAGSVSPYIGLFGTVWGIMHSFLGLSTAVNATLAAVAPGIAEALIATAIGLFAAIPAVIAYNQFTTITDQLAGRFDSFIDEFLNIMQRQAR